MTPAKLEFLAGDSNSAKTILNCSSRRKPCIHGPLVAGPQLVLALLIRNPSWICMTSPDSERSIAVIVSLLGGRGFCIDGSVRDRESMESSVLISTRAAAKVC